MAKGYRSFFLLLISTPDEGKSWKLLFNASGLADTPHDLSSWIYSFRRNCPLNSTRLIEIPVERIVQFSTLLHDHRCLASFYADACSPMASRRKTIHEERGEKEEPRKWRIPVIKSLVGRRTAGQPSVNWLLNLADRPIVLTLAVSSSSFSCVYLPSPYSHPCFLF